MSSISGLGNAKLQMASLQKSTKANEASSGKKTAQDVLQTLREKMPGWNISTTTADWGEGFRNIQIDKDILEKMANDPREMERVTNMLKEFEQAVPQLEQWQKENPDKSLIFNMTLDKSGNVAGMATLKTLLGAESNIEIDLSSSSWSENLLQKLGGLTQGQLNPATQSRSWTA